MANVGEVGGPRPQTQVSNNKGAQAAAGSTSVTGAKARQTAEAAYDHLFFSADALPGGALGAFAGDAVVAQEDRVQEALLLFGDLKENFLKEPPKGAVAEAFGELSEVFNRYGEVDFDQGELQLFSTTADGERVALTNDQRQEIGHAIDDALDRFWTKVTESVPDPAKLRDMPAFAFMQTPRAQQILKTLGPIMQKLWAPLPSGKVESMAGAASGLSVAKAKEEIANVEAKEQNASLSPNDASKLAQGLDQLLALGNGADIETLIQMVMMECGQDAAIDMREAMAALHKRTQEKRQLRDQIAAMKADRASVATLLQNEWKTDKDLGVIKKEVTLEEYSAARTIDWGTYDPTTGKVVPKSQLAALTGPLPPSIATGAPLEDVFGTLESGGKIEHGKQGKDVSQLQLLLGLAGYPAPVYNKPKEAKMDDITVASLNKFKADAGLPQDGICDASTLQALLGVNKILPQELSDFYKAGGTLGAGHEGEGGEQVTRQLQQMLIDAGKSGVTITGVMDAATLGAIAQVDADGSLNAADLLKLMPGYELTPTQKFEAQGGTLDPSPAPGESASHLSVKEMDVAIDNLGMQLDTLGDQSQEDQTRMQMKLDAYTGAYTLLSNIMKKISQAGDSIISNMK